MTKQEILDYFSLIDYAYNECGRLESLSRMLDELLKEQEAQKQSILKNIADTQLANSPDEWQSPEQKMYSKGVYDGLQMAYEMLAYGVVKK